MAHPTITSTNLTDRQAEVADCLARHLAIKEIARDLAISESAVNKHIAALKRHYEVSSRAGIVASFLDEIGENPSISGYRKPACRDSHLPDDHAFDALEASDDPGALIFSDMSDLTMDRWEKLNEPRIIPRWLDGKDSTARRLATILGMLIAILATVVLAVTAAQTVSEVVEGSDPDLALRDLPAI